MCSKCSMERYQAMSRRNFLKLGGASLAGATLFATIAPGKVLATPNDSSLAMEFEAAADKYSVPEELLLAVGYTNTRWEMPPPSLGDYEPGDLHGMGGYGIMHLRQEPSVDTLGDASKLTQIPEEKLKTDRESNILGGAAVLAKLVGNEKPTTLEGWYGAVAEYGGGSLYANSVFEVLQSGTSATTMGGEQVVLLDQAEAKPRQILTAQAAGDYYGSTWYGASSYNYTPANRPGSNPINKIIIHVTQGSWSGAINWFLNPDAQVSAHYTVRSSDGVVGQSVREKDIAWHAGNWSYNQTSIGIEHEGYVNNPAWFTEAMYDSSAKLSAYLCKKYGIPVDRSHIIGHNEVPDPYDPSKTGGAGHHTDPGSYWNWSKYMDYVRYYAGSGPAPPADRPHPKKRRKRRRKP